MSDPDLWHPIRGIERAKREVWARKMKFEELWNYIIKRSADICIPVVQDRTELEYVFNLMRNCTSYLEVGTAEGNSLYVLANAMPKGSEITYIDWAEKHTEGPRNAILGQLTDYKITPIHGDSNDYSTMHRVKTASDVVLIDAGHDDFNVALDAIFYGQFASKFIIFHDIQLPDVNRAFEWYCRQRPECKNYRIVNSTHFGYGIIEVNV